MSVDSDEEYQMGKSWISMKGLQQAADIKAVFRPKEEDRPHSPSSLNSSVSTEPAPNLQIHASPSFSGLHEGYMKGVMHRGPVHRRESSATTSRQLTSRFADEAVELRLELSRSQHEISRLNLELVRLQQEHKLELQKVYAHHERKIQKIRQEVEESKETVLRERRLKEDLEEVEREIEAIRNEYEERIETLKVEHELELQMKEEAFEKAIQLEIADTERKFLTQIDNLEKRHKAEMKQSQSPSEAGIDISKFRRVPKNTPVAVPEAPCSPKEQQNPDDRDHLIESQKAQIEELKSQLASALRKKPVEPLRSLRPSPFDTSEDLSASHNLEAELKQLIGQIEYHVSSLHLGEEEGFNATQSLTGTLKTLRGRIEMLSSIGGLHVDQ